MSTVWYICDSATPVTVGVAAEALEGSSVPKDLRARLRRGRGGMEGGEKAHAALTEGRCGAGNRGGGARFGGTRTGARVPWPFHPHLHWAGARGPRRGGVTWRARRCGLSARRGRNRRQCPRPPLTAPGCPAPLATPPTLKTPAVGATSCNTATRCAKRRTGRRTGPPARRPLPPLHLPLQRRRTPRRPPAPLCYPQTPPAGAEAGTSILMRMA